MNYTTQELADEEWRPVTLAGGAYIGRYEVSNLGRVRSLIAGKGNWAPLILRPSTQDGYLKFTLSRTDRRSKTESGHVLVADAFKGPRPIGLYVAHLDGTRNNNRETNLTYATPAENQFHRWKHGTRVTGESAKWSKLTAAQVRTIRKIYVFGSRKTGTPALARHYGVSVPTIQRVIERRSWTDLPD